MAQRRGVIALVFIFVLLGSLVLYAAFSMRRSDRPAPGANNVLVLDLPRTLDEAPPPFRPYSFDVLRYRERPLVIELSRGIRRAAMDDRVRALVVHVGDLEWGWARLYEIRDALQAFRASGKPLYASLESGGDPEYFLASAAGVISMPPTANLGLDGLTMSVMFLRGTLDKLDVRPNFASVGEYKSAVEAYTRQDMSPAARISLDRVLDDEYSLFVDSLASARGLTADTVRARIDRGPFTAAEAFATGWVDTLLYGADLDSLASRRARKHAGAVAFDRWLSRDEDGSGERVAWLAAEGAIASGKSRIAPGEGRVIGSETMVELLKDVTRKNSVRAVVLRIDSPGGDAQASDEIWRAVQRLARVKPVVVSMSDYAASGGYYIAMGGSKLVASPATLTGSIGIFGGKFNLLGLYRKLGLNVETLSRGAHADLMSPFRDFSEAERAIYQRQLEEFYRGFVAKVARNRGFTESDTDSLARGRVWTGWAAQQNGLVDTLGGSEAALAAVRSALGLEPDAGISLELYPQPSRTFFQQFVETLMGEEDDSSAGVLAAALPASLRRWTAAALLPPGRALALMPFALELR